jgi:hypothetical protein
MNKYSINLFQDELIPQKPWLTLTTVYMVWGLSLLAMIAWGVINYLHIEKLQVTHQQFSLQKKQLQQQVSQLEKQLITHQPSAELSQQLVQLKTVYQYKTALNKRLTDNTQLYVSGFAAAMTELAQHHHEDIRLQQVSIQPDNMLFKGLAKKPDAVPQWLSGFKSSQFLAGMSFSHFKLIENKQHLTEFVVSSKPPKNDESSGGVYGN